jgi:hypothetical protein
VSSTVYIPGGDAGVVRTEDAMAAAIDEATADPYVVGFARSLVASPTSYATMAAQSAAARTIRNFVWSVWRFVDDPVNRELLRTPYAMLKEYEETGRVMGDCDEAAVLGAALGASVGIQPTLTVLEFADDSGQYSHVYASLLPMDGMPVSLDVTRPPRGTPVPAVVRQATRAV